MQVTVIYTKQINFFVKDMFKIFHKKFLQLAHLYTETLKVRQKLYFINL